MPITQDVKNMQGDTTPEPIKIRAAALSDLETLLQFEQELIQAERAFDVTVKEGKINYYDIPEMIAAPHIHLVVAEAHNMVIGCGYARIERAKHFYKHPQHAYLGFMYVQPAHRGKGVNKKIIEALQQWAVTHNIYEIVLEVLHNNLPAVKAYEKAGFTGHLLQMRMGLAADAAT